MSSTPTFSLTLQCKIFKEGDQYVSHCLELNAATCGATVDEALRRTKELILIHLEEARDDGVLMDLLLQLNAQFEEAPADDLDEVLLNLVISQQTRERLGA